MPRPWRRPDRARPGTAGRPNGRSGPFLRPAAFRRPAETWATWGPRVRASCRARDAPRRRALSTAEDYLTFAQVLAGGGAWKGGHLLSPRSIDLRRVELVTSTTPGLPAGVGYGLGVRVLVDPGARNSLLSAGSFGWSGAFGTHFWVDPKAQVVGILMKQHQAPVPFLSDIQDEFETAVMQALVAASGQPR